MSARRDDTAPFRGWIDKPVRIDNNDLTKTNGTLRGISRRGLKVELADGRIRYAAWWRVSKVQP